MNLKADKIIRSRRRSLALEITPDARLVVRAPLYVKDREIDAVLFEKQAWILSKLGRMREQLAQFPLKPCTKEEIRQNRERAFQVLTERTRYFAQQYGFRYRSIDLSNAKKRWGSCSRFGRLRFNWRLVLAPLEVLDYVVVHELCHLKEQNHSSRFWNSVKTILPDYKARSGWLKENRHLLSA